MDGVLVAARTIHFASAMLLFGGLVFILAVATPVWLDADGKIREGNRRLFRLALAWGFWTLGASIASAAIWLAVEAALISGAPLAQALEDGDFGLVLFGTTFGRLWVWRFGFAAALGGLLLGVARSTGKEPGLGLAAGAATVAAVYLATLAFSGHSAAAEGPARYVQAVSDGVHGLAAGAWLGALPGLVFLLGRSQASHLSAQVVRRFSTLGVASVGALVVSGVANAWYLVGDVPALIGTDYGRLLIVKLALFAMMVALAAINRSSLRARHQAAIATDPDTWRSLRRNASMEIALGVIVVTIVGALGVMVPAAHQSPLWPFEHTLSWQAVEQTLVGGSLVVLFSIIAFLAAALALVAMIGGRWRLAMAGLAAFAAAGTICVRVLAVPAYPTTYAASPVRYTTGAVLRGAGLYGENCLACHGANGRGDGPAAASPGMVPTDLAAHASGHHPGELFWWIAHGIPGTRMQGFSPRLGESDLWDVVQFLRAQSDSATAAAVLGDHAQPWVAAIVAPDFTFERAGQEGQESLRQSQGNPITLLVLYASPPSLPYLTALKREAAAFAEIGLRVVAVPISGEADSSLLDREEGGPPPRIGALAQADVAKAYAMFGRKDGDSSNVPPAHVDYLIDRQGYVRARWIGIPASPVDRAAEVFDQAELLARERQRAPLPAGHVH
jgi:putative copper export protein/mono/diheme cytochrome c family protein